MGHVFAINESAIQLVNFTFDGNIPDTFFWLDRSQLPTRDGIRLSTFEYGLSPLGVLTQNSPIILILPEFEIVEDEKLEELIERREQLKINQFKSLSLFSLNGDVPIGIVRIPENLTVPKTQLIQEELRGTRYDVQSGPIQILDTKTIKIFGFIFQGDKAPDGYFYVGRGLNVTKEAGVKASIRGRDTSDSITPINDRYTGGKDIYVELPNGYDVQHIDWLSIYCLRFEVDYGHVFIRNISPMIPPHVEIIKKSDEPFKDEKQYPTWHISNLLGTDSQLNFTFQLGPPGGIRGHKSMRNVSKSPPYVWYVNGYLADIYLKRGITYTFIVEGGQNSSIPELYNPLYLTDSIYGAFSKLSNSEKKHAIKYTQEESGRLCRWLEDVTGGENFADKYDSFVDFRETLRLECDDSDEPGILTFTPGINTPNVLYYASYSNYQMGGRILIVNEFPSDLKDIVVEPYRYDAKRHQERMVLARESNGIIRNVVKIFTFSIMFLIILL
ncbi:hypothetical protein Mgra_00006335 [Meloidogyne graminicola]|uniref:DM13 domain-containing protein n=1 Tax=Meloidogyne graminicola TaxID=189291 RepID=A0A8S9ZM61_9BILA|nr:hypothetical protein Mgra_00006335 [Meloidogyne graminicola]